MRHDFPGSCSRRALGNSKCVNQGVPLPSVGYVDVELLNKTAEILRQKGRQDGALAGNRLAVTIELFGPEAKWLCRRSAQVRQSFGETSARRLKFVAPSPAWPVLSEMARLGGCRQDTEGWSSSCLCAARRCRESEDRAPMVVEAETRKMVA